MVVDGTPNDVKDLHPCPESYLPKSERLIQIGSSSLESFNDNLSDDTQSAVYKIDM